MAQKRSKLAKIFVYLALAAVCIGVIAPFITYFGVEYFDWNKCDEWYIRNEETQECEEEIVENNTDFTKINNEETCIEVGWTWYEENWICIETSNVEEIIETLEETVE